MKPVAGRAVSVRRRKAAQYTIRAVPAALDRALRERARRAGKSLNETVLETLQRGIGESAPPVRHNDLDDFIGTWVEDPKFDEAMEAQRQIDWELWR